jgi:TetR/AcrR family transcriptional repressor of nem operon
MARKNSVDLELTKNKILEAGLDTFKRQGFNATGIQEIASIAGVPKGSFYNYFGSKEEFGVAIIFYYSAAYVKKWHRLLAQGGEDPYLAMKYVFVQMIVEYEEAEHKPGCLLGNLAAELSEASEDCRVAMQQVIHGWKNLMVEQLVAGQQSGKVRCDLTAEQLADFFWDCWQGSLLRMKIENSTVPVSSTFTILFDHVMPV